MICYTTREKSVAVECQSPRCTRSVTFSVAGNSRWTLAVPSTLEKISEEHDVQVNVSVGVHKLTCE
jgi:hypothetical protein